MKNFILLIFLIVGTYSCSDIFEEEIFTEKIQLLSPADNVETESSNINFNWEPIEGCDSYLLKVATPDFITPENIITEDEILQTEFSIDLEAGEYEWFVVGENSTYSTIPSDTFALSVGLDTTQNLSGTIITLLTPEDDFFINSQDITFLWQPVASVIEYNLQLSSPDFSNSTFFLDNVRISTDNYDITSLPEGEYSWRVRGENNQGVTPYSTKKFIIDITPPNSPSLNLPINNTEVDLPVVLNWTVDESSNFDSLFIYSDSLISPPILSLSLTDTEYIFSDSSEEEYFWRVRSQDEAGNTSEFTELRKFIIN